MMMVMISLITRSVRSCGGLWLRSVGICCSVWSCGGHVAAICWDMLQCVELWRVVGEICWHMAWAVELRVGCVPMKDVKSNFISSLLSSLCLAISMLLLIISNIPLMKASSSRLRSSACLLLSSDCINLRSDAATISFIFLAKAPAVCSLLVWRLFLPNRKKQVVILLNCS